MFARFLPLIFIVTYLLISMLQLIASIDGIMYFFGLHWIFAGFAGLLLVFIPGIGPLAGVYGAVAVWGWPPLAAILLFFWPYIFYAIITALGIAGSFFVWKRLFRPFYTASKKDYIDADFTVKEPDDETFKHPPAFIENRDRE